MRDQTRLPIEKLTFEITFQGVRSGGEVFQVVCRSFKLRGLRVNAKMRGMKFGIEILKEWPSSNAQRGRIAAGSHCCSGFTKGRMVYRSWPTHSFGEFWHSDWNCCSAGTFVFAIPVDGMRNTANRLKTIDARLAEYCGTTWATGVACCVSRPAGS